jgi:hypothetical protein
MKAASDPAKRFDGVGFVFSGLVGEDGKVIGGVDFDHLEDRKDGETDDTWMLARQRRAAHYLPRFKEAGAYIERSPSGTGFHVICFMRRLDKGAKAAGVEVYTSERYFTVTGQSNGQGNGEIADCTEIVDALIAEIAPDRANGSKHFKPASSQAASPAVVRHGAISREDLPEDVRRILHDFTNNTFDGGPLDREKRARLLAGNLSDYADDHSAADLSLCSQLAHRGASADQIDMVVRASGRYRPKWDEKRGSGTYGSRTIAKAMKSVETVAATAVVSMAGALHKGPGHTMALHGSSALTPITPGVKVPVWSSWNTMPSIMDEATALSQVNDRMCFVRNHGGAPAYLMAQPDGRFTVLKPSEVTTILAGFYVQFATQDGPKKVPLALRLQLLRPRE